VRIVYFVHDLDDPAVERRIAMLRDADASTLALGFRRRAGTTGVSQTDTRVLGHTRNGRMLARIMSVLTAGAMLSIEPADIGNCDVVVARNLEMLALAVTSRTVRQLRLPIVYECLDIHALLSSDRRTNRFLRLVERALLRRCALLIVSSERYLPEHFLKYHRHIPPVLLIENKVLASEFANPVERRNQIRRPGPVWRVGWFGVLRCRRTLLILQQLALLMPGRIQIIIRGRPARDVIPDFDQIVATPAIHFGGPYDRERDLASIYAGVDLVWAIDFYEEGLNSAWLLPNRLYESVLFGCIPLASSSSETGRWLRTRGFDHTLDDVSLDAVLTFIAGLDGDRIDDADAKLAAIPLGDVLCDSDQARSIVSRLPRRG
jgi:succinoglycan biosynthesis protein ExoL